MMRIGLFNNNSPFKFSVEGYFANWGSNYTDKRNNNLSNSLRIHFYGGTSYANSESYQQNQGNSFIAGIPWMEPSLESMGTFTDNTAASAC